MDTDVHTFGPRLPLEAGHERRDSVRYGVPAREREPKEISKKHTAEYAVNAVDNKGADSLWAMASKEALTQHHLRRRHA